MARSWLPVWSSPAALRALRATVAVPGLFAFSLLVVGDLQMATFAAFGCFANLVLAGFGGTRRDRLIGHLALALLGSALVAVGTAVSGSAVVAALVTVPVVFAVLFSGVIGPNAASAATAGLLAYVLPAASAGTAATIPSRLVGWWLAAAVSTALVMLVTAEAPGDRLRAAAATAARALAAALESATEGKDAEQSLEAALAAKHALFDVFTAAEYRSAGLAAADQALAGSVESVEWAAAAVADALREQTGDGHAPGVDRGLLTASATMLRDAAELLLGADVSPGFDELERQLDASAQRLRQAADLGRTADLHRHFHARVIAAAARNTAAEALIASGRMEARRVATLRESWYGESGVGSAAPRHPLIAAAGRVTTGHANVRSIWFVNSLRGAMAIAAAIAVADLTSVQHGFWVVLGTLSVLRSSATATGASAVRALVGTVIGFAVGGALIVAIGTNRTVLWAMLPVAVMVAAYAPGTAPFAVGQAAFTVVVSILYNLLVPVGWTVGVVRIEDVAIGCAVSVVVGGLFWPRGAAGVVGEDLAEAFLQGGEYLRQAARWALGLQENPPDRAGAAVTAGLRVDEALRGFLAEQGARSLPRRDLWHVAFATLRLRVTAHSLARLRDTDEEPAREVIGEQAERLAGWYEELGGLLARPAWASPARRVQARAPRLDGLASSLIGEVQPSRPRHLWVALHLEHLRERLPELAEPATAVIERSRRPWWR